MITPRDECCRRCTWWEGWRRADHSEGRCRRHAPTVSLLVTTSNCEAGRTTFPATRGDDWCGDFVRASPQQLKDEGSADD